MGKYFISSVRSLSALNLSTRSSIRTFSKSKLFPRKSVYSNCTCTQLTGYAGRFERYKHTLSHHTQQCCQRKNRKNFAKRQERPLSDIVGCRSFLFGKLRARFFKEFESAAPNKKREYTR